MQFVAIPQGQRNLVSRLHVGWKGWAGSVPVTAGLSSFTTGRPNPPDSAYQKGNSMLKMDENGWKSQISFKQIPKLLNYHKLPILNYQYLVTNNNLPCRACSKVLSEQLPPKVRHFTKLVYWSLCHETRAHHFLFEELCNCLEAACSGKPSPCIMEPNRNNFLLNWYKSRWCCSKCQGC